MDRDTAKEELENVLKMCKNEDDSIVYERLFQIFRNAMGNDENIDEYLLKLSEISLSVSRKADLPKKTLFLRAHKLLRKLAHKIYREYNDNRVKNGFLTLVGD